MADGRRSERPQQENHRRCWPLASIADILHQPRDSVFFSTLNLARGFHQIIKVLSRVLKYLFKTKNLSLNFVRDNKTAKKKVDCHVDSDYAKDHVDRKSTTGYII